ncbi:Zinc finger CCCH domain-containing protein [Colletotrichum spinosum]|uniref:Zinc finger CCCH domain-containing protein n=1 Tax=Colletotrichum spinosum TaxID=1347390 RepID=A0A4R8PPJ4_9PEZI|nr:Zinc finger CCCH domain-containing protein [Colletotrichum spinosum]
MTSPEEQELLAKIGQLAGKINLHKAQQAGVHSIPSSHTSYHRHSTFRPGGNGHRHRVGPYPARGPTGYRNRSLVLGNGGTQTPPSESSTPESTGPTSSSTWISKNTPGQRSLINSAVYKENSEATSKAIEATRQQRLVKQNAREKSQLVNHFQRYNGRPSAPGTPTNPAAVGQHEVEIEGIRYRVAHNGSKLIKISGDLHPANATPKVAFVGGVKFHRSKTGNLYRAGVLKAHRQNGIKKVDMPCSMFSLTGSCAKGPACRYKHDASRVAVCRELLHKGSCVNGESCDLSHDLTPQRTPTCVHFIKGNCSNPNCQYAHSSISPSALVCRSFGLYGYCDKGDECEERHVFECPDFSNTGKCKNRSCKLLHRERASVLRKRAEGDEMEDLSSDEEEADSDDVDSDEVEEFVNDAVGDDSDFKVQKDFIAF